jgi:hypothetical protein
MENNKQSDEKRGRYLFSELYNMDKLPEDTNDYVLKCLEPIFQKFPQLEEETRTMFKVAREKREYTDKNRAIIFNPDTQLPIATIEFHKGVVKNFSFPKFYGKNVYFPINLKNKKVIFDGGGKDGVQR